MSSKTKLQMGMEKLVEMKSHHRTLQHSTESSMVRILEILQHYQATFMSNSEEVDRLKKENLRLKNEVQRLEFSLNDVRLAANSEAELRIKYEKELDDYSRLIAVLKDLINSGSSNRDAHLSRLADKDRELLDMATFQHTLKKEEAKRKPRFSDKFNKTPDFNLAGRRSWCSDGETSTSQADALSSEEELRIKEIQRKSKRRSSVHLPEETPKQKHVRYDNHNHQQPLHAKWPMSAHVGGSSAVAVHALASTGSSSASLESVGNQAKHCFTKKTILRTEDCTVCGKKLKFSNEAHKCKNCKFVCHSACKMEALLRPCPKNVVSGIKSIGKLAQFCPTQPPYVPKVLATIVKEIEARGRTESGLYRIPGTHKIVGDIMDQISRSKTPYLSGHDIHTVCSVMKDFIRRMEEPIVSYRLHKQFMNTADMDSSDAAAVLVSLISELPVVNRDTLSFIMLHLKRVAQWKHCSMGSDNLSKIFGPTLIRHSAECVNTENNAMALEEARQHPLVMQRLFDIPEHFWSQFLTPSSSGGAQHDTDATSSESDVPPVTPAGCPRTPGTVLRTISEDRLLDSAGGTGTDSDTPVMYGPSSAVAHRTRYKNIGINKGSRYFTSPLR
ncbi:uncharacterized protein LOC142344482 [Convolutriloba macropyga]|uniref:uncharacterized protein LOC142344482 n=1 Tax=Convolutriloba macropyga TaxID=536237 RepID=UPI003F520F3C